MVGAEWLADSLMDKQILQWLESPEFSRQIGSVAFATVHLDDLLGRKASGSGSLDLALRLLSATADVLTSKRAPARAAVALPCGIVDELDIKAPELA